MFTAKQRARGAAPLFDGATVAVGSETSSLRFPAWLLVAGVLVLPVLGGLLTLLAGQWLQQCNFLENNLEISSDCKTQESQFSTDASSSSSRFLVDPYPARGPIRWEHLSKFIQAGYTMNGTIAVSPWYFDDSVEAGATKWSNEWIEEMLGAAKAREAQTDKLASYGYEANWGHFEALNKYPVANMSVLVLGSIRPWIEAICLTYGASLVTTVDFNVPSVSYPKLRTISVAELDASDEKFDAVFSYSSLEHDGLGRYGDPIDPDGDLKRMEKIKGLLKPGGKFYLGLPNGNDTLQYNAHRIYGRIRFPLLIEGWNLLETFGTPLEACYDLPSPQQMQPLHVLTLP